MLVKTLTSTTIALLLGTTLGATTFDDEAKKDRKAVIDYFEAKFQDPAKNQASYFPYTSKEELEKEYDKNLKHEDFSIGSYSYAKGARAQYEDIKEMPPYEDAIDEGEELYGAKFANGKSFEDCFPKTDIVGDYPFFDTKRGEIITLSVAINECLVANKEKPWNTKKGNMAKLQAYFASQTAEAEKKLDIKIPNKEASEAYKRGKIYYYSQRGYLKLSCASCHVQGAGQRVRNEKLSPLLGQFTHFPVYRLKWQNLGTLERRMSGCIKDQGQVPPKDDSKEMRELLYFMAYMSNGMTIDGPDVRK